MVLYNHTVLLDLISNQEILSVEKRRYTDDGQRTHVYGSRSCLVIGAQDACVLFTEQIWPVQVSRPLPLFGNNLNIDLGP